METKKMYIVLGYEHPGWGELLYFGGVFDSLETAEQAKTEMENHRERLAKAWNDPELEEELDDGDYIVHGKYYFKIIEADLNAFSLLPPGIGGYIE